MQMKTTVVVDILSDLIDVSEILAQMVQFIFNNIFCVGCHQMIVMETACLQTVEIYYCGGYVPLVVTMYHVVVYYRG